MRGYMYLYLSFVLQRNCLFTFSIADSVSSFFNARVSSIGGTFDILLLKSLPIIHFIKTKSAVIASIPPKDVKWGDDTLSLHSIRRKFPQDLYEFIGY